MYKIVRCHHCKTYSITTADKVFKCLKCNKSHQLHRMKIHFSTENPQIATKVLQKIKQEEFIQKKGTDYLDEFM